MAEFDKQNGELFRWIEHSAQTNLDAFLKSCEDSNLFNA